MPNKTIHGRHYGTGKRKNAVARVFLKEGSGQFRINGREFEDYFPRDILRLIVNQPFALLGRLDGFDVDVNVHGSGITSQAQAIRHGISRALLGFDETFRGPL